MLHVNALPTPPRKQNSAAVRIRRQRFLISLWVLPYSALMILASSGLGATSV